MKVGYSDTTHFEFCTVGRLRERNRCTSHRYGAEVIFLFIGLAAEWCECGPHRLHKQITNIALFYARFSLCRMDLTHTASSFRRLAIWSQTVKHVAMRSQRQMKIQPCRPKSC